MKCDLCKKKINEKKDRYVHVEDYNKGKKENEIWTHLKCFNKAMNKNREELLGDIFKVAGKIFNKLKMENEGIYYVK